MKFSKETRTLTEIFDVMGVIKLCFCMIIISQLGSCLASKNSKLLVVSFDGFRNDYFNRSLTPALGKLMETSSYKSRLLNVFPTQTFPNHFSIATGLYVEDHGVIGSEAMDVDKGSVLTYGYKLFHYDENVTPIWTLNELSNGSHHSGCLMWPGCNMDYRGKAATYSVEFNVSMPWEHRINLSISWFKKAVNPANLVMLYFESPDQEEHIYGPNSAQTNAQIKRSDDAVATILSSLEQNNLTDVNMVFLSDHGMEAVTLSRIINLTDVINGLGQAVGTSPVLQIYPKKGKLEELYLKLHQYSLKNRHFDVYKKQDIPERFRYKKCKRAPPILAVAKPGYGFQDLYPWIEEVKGKYNLTVNNDTEFGVHGYDPEIASMQPFLIAHGPKFGHNMEIPNRTVDLFEVFVDVLGLQSMSSTMKRPRKMLKSQEGHEDTGITVRLVLFSLASSIGLATLFFVFILFQRRHSARNMGYTLVDKDDSTI